MAEIKSTPQQKMAVNSQGAALLVSAAAGSGKTKVLVDRVMRQICDPIAPKNINSFLIITYTKAAAAELRGKIANAIGKAIIDQPTNRHLQRQLSKIYLAQISTVHSFCMSILRDYANELGIYPDFRIAEEQESIIWQQKAMEETLNWAYESMKNEPEISAFLDRLGAGRDDRSVSTILLQAYRSVGCHPNPDDWIKQCISELDVNACVDISETPWGKLLMDYFVNLLDEQILSMERGLSRLTTNPIVEKKYAPIFCENLEQLRYMRDSKTWDELYSRRIQNFGKLNAVRGQSKEELERFRRPRKQCIEIVKKAQETISLSSEEAIAEIKQSAPIIRGMFRLLQEFIKRYQAIKQKHRMLDFGDLEHEALRLLRYPNGTPTVAAREISHRYCEIMVDEYQDSNAVQDAIFEAVSDHGRNLFMVGDVKQSIYRFRLADPSIFLQKYQLYHDISEATQTQARRVLLTKNFRSRKEILWAVNDIFRMTMSEQIGDLNYGDDEALYPGKEFPLIDGPRVELHCLDTSEKSDDDSKRSLEARLTAKRVAELLVSRTPVTEKERLRAVEPSDIVILLRSLHSQASEYVHALHALGIDAVCDQSEDILKSSEVSVLISYLQILDNPHQDIPLLSVLLSPVFGFSVAQTTRVRENNHTGDFYEALCEYSKNDDTFVPFLQQLNTLRRISKQEPIGTVVRMIFEETGLRDIFSAMPDGEERLANIQQIYLIASAFDPEGPSNLHDFLLKIEQRRQYGIYGDERHNKNAVHIMSIHKSKGLEFPVVIVAGLSTKFNTTDDRQTVQIHSALGAGCDVVDLDQRIQYPSLAKRAVLKKLSQERLSEELRVLYVALTRPKDLLIMIYASAHLQSKLQSIADQVSEDGPISLSRRADSIGYWVLMAAMRRGEAGELFALGGKPDETVVSDAPWLIKLWKPEQLQEMQIWKDNYEIKRAKVDLTEVSEASSFIYPYKKATITPAKLTATQIKGRFLDDESAEGTFEAKRQKTNLRQPLFLQGQRPLNRTEQGTAMHLAMQYICYDNCTCEESVRQELKRLVDEGFLLEQQASCVSPDKIVSLFRSPIGQRILSAPKVIREFKFSLFVDAGEYDPLLSGESIMLQGVTDCCLLETDGLCVIDFKTDRIKPGNESISADKYRGQMESYCLALSRIFECPVKEKYLYFFATNTFYAI